MIDKQSFIRDCAAIRKSSPLVHNITNYVAMEINANALLAIGASPLMSFCPEEMEEIVSIASALVVNIGCRDRHEIEGMKIAAATAHRLGKPWVLDPVGAGASKIRTQTCIDLIRESHPTVIRGNASEIMVLAGQDIISRGVDSNNSSSDAEAGARALAKRTGAAVSVSGQGCLQGSLERHGDDGCRRGQGGCRLQRNRFHGRCLHGRAQQLRRRAGRRPYT